MKIGLILIGIAVAWFASGTYLAARAGGNYLAFWSREGLYVLLPSAILALAGLVVAAWAIAGPRGLAALAVAAALAAYAARRWYGA